MTGEVVRKTEVDEKSEGGMRMMQNKQMIVADAVKWVRRGR